MILLDGHSLTAQEKFTPESMQLTLEERRSQATLTVGPAAPAISVGDWMRDDTEPGSGILWRVKSVSHQIDRDTRTIALEHISATLRDYVIFGEWEPEEGCTAQEAVAYALGQTGGLWVTGTWEAANPSNPYKFASTNVMSALENVSATIGGVFWEYDLTQIPFRLHFRLIPDAAASEMRMNRNIVSLRRSIDRSRMYTRIYPIGADDLHITGDYLSKNEAVYGTVSHIETNQGIENEAELTAWAQQRLDTHCEPAVSIQISGLDYSRETGEALDALAIGTRCRVPLPEYGTTILETLTRLTWKDKIGKPEEVTVNLANIQEDVASIFKKVAGDAASNSRAGGRGAKKKQEEDHAWFVDTTDHVAMVAEAIVGEDEEGDLWSRVATVVVDGEGIHQRVTATENGIAAHGTAIEQNEQRIGLAVGSYQIDEEQILRYPGGVSTFPSEGQTGYFYLDTSVTPNRMYIWKDGKYTLLQVSQDGSEGFLIKAGEIAIAINESGESEAVIDASKVVIGSGISQESLPDWMDTTEGLIADKATVGQLNALTARVGTLESDTIKTTNLSAAFTNLGSASIATLTADNLYIKPNAGMGGVSVAGALTNLRLQESGGTYTLQCLKFNSSSWEDVGTFSRAASTSKASGSWSGSTYTVSADPNGSYLPVSTSVYLTAEGTPNPSATVYAKVYKDNPSVAENQLDALEMTLQENTRSQTVTLVVNTLTKGSVSTAATYRAGWYASMAEIEVLPDEDVTLSAGESQTVTVKAKTSPSGNLVTVSSFTITAAGTATNKVSGAWNGTTYTVSSNSSGQALPINTSVFLTVEGTANPGATVYAKIYKNDPSVSANQLTSTAMTLTENVSSKTVTLTANSLTKGSISTQATYNAGWLASYNVIEVLPDEDVTLGYGESQTVTVKAKTSPSGNLTTVSSFTITAPAAPSANKVTGSWSGTTYTVSASSGGQSLPINTSVYLAVEGTANPGTTIYAKIYKDSPSVSANQLTSTAMTLTENVSSKTVTLTANSLTKGSISTQATYNAGQQALISAGGPLNTTSNGSGRLDRYVTTYSVDVDTGGQTIVAAPVFTLPTTLGSGSTRTSITVTATSSASGQTPAATTTNMILQTGTYTSSGTTKYCAEIYSVNESRVIARRDITELVSGAASTASVEFYRWTQTTGSNAGAGNTIRFINANNSSKYADRSIQLVENDGWVYANDTTDGTRVAQIQESGGSTAGVHLKAEWNAANTSVTVSKVTTGSMNTVTFNISAAAFAEYDSTTHKYTAYGQAKVNNVEKGAVASYVSGTEAYEAGQTAGWEQGNSDGAAAAWNIAKTAYPPTPGTSPRFSVRVPTSVQGVMVNYTYGLMLIGTADNTNKTATGDIYLIKNYGDDSAAQTVMTVNVDTELDSIYSAGYNKGKSESSCSHTFWGYVGLYQSSINIEGETYALYAFSQSRKTYATTRVYK